MIILAFSSFEKFNFLRVENLTMIDNDFSVSFLKGKTYRELRYGVIPSIPSKDFDTANIFSIYLDKLALLHAEGNSNIDYLFPNIRLVKGKEFPLNTPFSYIIFGPSSFL